MNQSAPNHTAIRARVRDKFRELGIENESTIHETVLIRDGLYVGRRFHSGPLQAVWNAGEDDVAVFREEEAAVPDEVTDHDQWRTAA